MCAEYLVDFFLVTFFLGCPGDEFYLVPKLFRWTLLNTNLLPLISNSVDEDRPPLDSAYRRINTHAF